MKRFDLPLAPLLATLALWLASAPVRAEEPTANRAYELRVYTAHDGKLEDLHRRFREHTLRLFEKHGMSVVAFWTPTDERAANTLVYVLSYPSAEARAQAWRAFADDPDWQRVYRESHANGPLVAKVESTMMAPTDYSPLR